MAHRDLVGARQKMAESCPAAFSPDSCRSPLMVPLSERLNGLGGQRFHPAVRQFQLLRLLEALAKLPTPAQAAAGHPIGTAYALKIEDVERVVATIRAMGMLPIATPFSPDDVDLIAGLALPAVKIASPDLVNRPLLRRVAELRRPMLISTGASTVALPADCSTASGCGARW